MDKIKIANGASYNCSFCATIPDGTAFVALDTDDFSKAAQIFGNPNNTRRMEYGNYILTGFTELVDLGKQPYGIQAVLKGGTVTERSGINE